MIHGQAIKISAFFAESGFGVVRVGKQDIRFSHQYEYSISLLLVCLKFQYCPVREREKKKRRKKKKERYSTCMCVTLYDSVVSVAGVSCFRVYFCLVVKVTVQKSRSCVYCVYPFGFIF